VGGQQWHFFLHTSDYFGIKTFIRDNALLIDLKCERLGLDDNIAFYTSQASYISKYLYNLLLTCIKITAIWSMYCFLCKENVHTPKAGNLWVQATVTRSFQSVSPSSWSVLIKHEPGKTKHLHLKSDINTLFSHILLSKIELNLTTCSDLLWSCTIFFTFRIVRGLEMNVWRTHLLWDKTLAHIH